MRLPPIVYGLIFCVFCATAGLWAQSAATGLGISTPSPDSVVVGSKFIFTLAVMGGVAPYNWHLAVGHLPSGLKLHAHAGTISGVPVTPGEYHFTVAVSDSSIPVLQAEREITIVVTAGILLDWKQSPKADGATLSGSVGVTNQTGNALELTVIVVAVNRIGRATALGYQHFIMAADAQQVIPFSSNPGPEQYTVRVDAVGHRTNGHYTYRVAKETTDRINVSQ